MFFCKIYSWLVGKMNYFLLFFFLPYRKSGIILDSALEATNVFHNFLIIKTLDEKRLIPLIYNELSLCYKLEFSNPDIFTTWWFKTLIFQMWSNRIYSLKYLRSTRLGSNDIWIRKSKFEAKNQFLWFGFGPNPFLFS